jgi:ferredoxin
MKVHVDTNRCQGHARCWDVAPEVYNLDDLGYCLIEAEEVPPGLEEAARKGAAVCPERAITVEE